jgi:RNA-directed DNA polymerase
VSLATPAKLRKLQRALYVTAKQNPGRRFHVLYDKVWREDILAHAFALSRENGGAPGVDGCTNRRRLCVSITSTNRTRRSPWAP